jgi:hypothetical protein
MMGPWTYTVTFNQSRCLHVEQPRVARYTTTLRIMTTNIFLVISNYIQRDCVLHLDMLVKSAKSGVSRFVERKEPATNMKYSVIKTTLISISHYATMQSHVLPLVLALSKPDNIIC